MTSSNYFQNLFIILTIYSTCIQCSTLSTSGLEIVSDDNIVDMIKQNEFVIVLFSKPDCVECDIFETYLFNLRNDFKDNLGAKVVKAINSQLVRLYSPTKEPAVVFFRHGIPLLYDGINSEDEIYMRFDENRSPIVKELSDENFEHLTQASTGSTTGDWLILFYNRECIECQRLSAVWEAVGAATKNRLNVARIDKDVLGAGTAKRFNVQKAPEFIFIRQGNFYRYEIPKYDVKSFVSFATEWYKNSKTEKVKTAASPFDDLVTATVNFIKQIQVMGVKAALNEYQYTISLVIIGITVLLVIMAKCCCGSSSSKKASEEKKKSDKDKKKKTK